ncbi:MAG: L-threonylcarbamoyladenylate synthase [SAR324 cluster bacterium]|nr:L-threonylcarbamoyladenylate synthase [SAR324 cluster bacterium]
MRFPLAARLVNLFAVTMRSHSSPASEILAFPFSSEEREAAARALAAGRVMIYPTETSYALGGNALDGALVETVFRLKGRQAEKPLLLLIDPPPHLPRYTRRVRPAAQSLMARFWPGPLTLVFEAGADLPAHLSDRRGTVALRCSSHAAVAELLALGGVPLIGTSANASGQAAASEVSGALAAFGAKVALAVDGGPTPGGPPSTVLDTTVRPFRVLRNGAIPADALRAALRREYPDEAPQPAGP